MSLRPSEQAGLRRSSFKASVGAADGLGRRVSSMDGIRKEVRSSALRKRRCGGAQAAEGAHPEAHEKTVGSASGFSRRSIFVLEAGGYLLVAFQQNPPIQEVINCGVLPCLVRLLSREDYPELQFEAAWALTNIASGTSENTMLVVKPALLVLRQLIHSEDKDVLADACWALSYLTHRDEAHTQAVINGNLIGPLVHLMGTAESAISNGAAWAITNATCGGTHDQIKYLVSQGCIKAFCDFLGHSDPRILKVCLEGLENILMVGEAEKSLGNCDINMYAEMIEDVDALDKIEDLQNHDNITIYHMAVRLLETFWVEEDDAMPSEENAPQASIHDTKLDVSVPPGAFNFG
ncbi:hypothetical protein HU200_005367 [Digitaria exilis]|uniref:Importin alpha subunit n=1 Tax=Digitaria exilis TaxID=1010633 RepID=A0A835FR37_9POAL|nr:hypothetical protein HU200_005367 [Digitaria exilis]